MSAAASERYNARVRSAYSDRGRRELQKLIVDDLAAQCDGSKPPTDGLASASPGQRRYACKAISDFRDTQEFEGLFDVAIDLFIVITNKAYNGESFEQMVTQIRVVKLFLEEQAQLFGLFGDMRAIHTAVVVSELVSQSSEDLVNYCQLVFIPIPDEYQDVFLHDPAEPLLLSKEKRELLETYALFGKLANLERLRIATYVHDVLFGDADNRLIRFEGSLTFYDVPLAADVIDRGTSYYYPRVGVIDNNELTSRYHPFELLCVLAQLDRGRMVAECGWISTDISSRIITTLQKRGWDDPRSVVTPLGVRSVVHAPDYTPQLTLARDFHHSYADLRAACEREGIRTEGTHGRKRSQRDLMHDYIVAQLGEDFFAQLPGYVNAQEVSLGVYVASGDLQPHDEPRSDVLWYGGRNGTSSFRCMTFRCLADLWTRLSRFACPFDEAASFPVRTIRRLAFMLQNEGDHPEARLLARVVSGMLWSQSRRFGVSDEEVASIDALFDRQRRLVTALRTSYPIEKVRWRIIHLYNLALYFSRWTDEGPTQLFRDLPLDDNQDVRRFNALIALSSILAVMQEVPELGQLAIVRPLSEMASESLERGSPEWLDQQAPYAAYELELNASTIGEYLQLLVSAHRFGIDHMLEHAATVLQLTAEKYGQDVLDTSFFRAFTFELDEPTLTVTDLGITHEWDLRPALLDLVKGEAVPADTTDGKWQALPANIAT
jgi:hypothetical protein